MAGITGHVVELRATGATLRTIADAAGCSQATIGSIERGAHPLVLASIARRILVVRATDVAPSRVSALGASRRVRALYAAGYPLNVITAELGLARTFISGLANDARERVSYATHRTVVEAYERLSGTPGPSEYSRMWAQRRSWAPPLAWDDVDIDDPNAVPDFGGRALQPLAIAENVEFIRRTSGIEDRDLIAARLGIKRDALDKNLDRAKALTREPVAV